MKQLWLFIAISTVFLSGCRSLFDDIAANSPCWISPNGKVLVYQYHSSENDEFTISLMSWFKTGAGEGGGGVFDMKLMYLDTLNVSWINDSTVKVFYPLSAEILRQEDESYFLGNRIHFVYSPNSD
jgi:hypothetical protein